MIGVAARHNVNNTTIVGSVATYFCGHSGRYVRDHRDSLAGRAGLPVHAVRHSLIAVFTLSAWAIELPILPYSALLRVGSCQFVAPNA